MKNQNNPSEKINKICLNMESVILGKSSQIKIAVLALVSGGHILMEDVPGVGKTILAKSLARSVSADFKRIQFTPDLLPADVTGTAILEPNTGNFHFQKGPVFTNVLLADEINRASPRTQSALLEAMSEGQVSAEGESRTLPSPFVVVATQNPVDFQGTYPLPEAQLDRFSVRLELGYTEPDVEADMLLAQAGTHPFENLKSVISTEEICEIGKQIREVNVSRAVAEYIVSIVSATRQHNSIQTGVSPRGSLALFKTSQAHALSEGRDFCMPDDVKAVAVPVLSHRMILETKAKYSGMDTKILISDILDQIKVPV